MNNDLLVNKSKKNILEYCKLRGEMRKYVYKDKNVHILKQPEDKNTNVRGGYTSSSYMRLESESNVTIIYWITCLGVKNLKKITESLKFQKQFATKNIIIIYKSKSPGSDNNAKLYMDEFQNIKIEFLSIDELQYNIFDNDLIPSKIRILNEDEVNEMVLFYKNVKMFPKLKPEDNIRRYLDIKKGEIVCFSRIENNSVVSYLRIAS
uniref:Uncharacterized protein n=1 Tax=viral metagenome TaxID=1070528 RepID=A0A6C0JPG9_9ZZZZ